MITKTARERLHQAISEITPFNDGNEEEEETPDAGVLTGWVLVAEWQGSDGNRWLSKLSASAVGDEGLPSWTERGMCHEVAFHWPADSE